MKPNSRQPMVSSLALTFKRATQITEDVAEAKKEHRANLRSLIDRFMQDVEDGNVPGIRNAKDLVEVIKLDLLLLGEATERTENTSDIDEVKVHKVAQVIDINDPTVQDLMTKALMALNNANDDADTSPVKRIEQPELEAYDDDVLGDRADDGEDD